MASVAVWIKQKLGVEPWVPKGQGRMRVLSSLLSLYSRSDAESETLLARKVLELEINAEMDDYETRWLDRLRDLTVLRALVFGKQLSGKYGLRQGFAYTSPAGAAKVVFSNEALGVPPSLQDVTESATVVADLYWKLYKTCTGEYPELKKLAISLYEGIFGEAYEESRAREYVTKLTDTMQRDHGLPFLLLNLMRQGRQRTAKEVSQLLLTGESDLDEEIRSPLYWMSEIFWFTQAENAFLVDHEATIRYLYHLCFTNPDRTGFLEIDSQFFSEFDTVNEIAREGFIFRETLFEWTLGLWKEYEGIHDGIFQNVLEVMSRRQSKIHDERVVWEAFWRREQETFSRDYLYVVEGNLSYAAGHYEEALECFDHAVALNPDLRAARLNRVFCLAQLGLSDRHAELAETIATDKDLIPAGLYVAGNSYLLANDESQADEYFRVLGEIPGWERKTEYYRSTFCFAHRRFEQALKFARLAAILNSGDPSINYHLSLCYNAMGNKEKALETVNQMGVVPHVQWLDYYRFTLERDSGKHHEASETLMRIPREYFEDEELEEAVQFARLRQDLTLLRHLKRRK